MARWALIWLPVAHAQLLFGNRSTLEQLAKAPSLSSDAPRQEAEASPELEAEALQPSEVSPGCRGELCSSQALCWGSKIAQKSHWKFRCKAFLYNPFKF